MKTIHLFISFLFVVFSFSLYSQTEVVIKGKATGAEGKVLNLFACYDQLTYSLTKVASANIDTTGKFSFTFKTDRTFYAYLKIDFNQAPIYIEPGKTYDLSIKCPDCKSPDDKTNPYLKPKDLDVVIANSDSTELNNLIIRFNADYQNFIVKNYTSLLKLRKRSKLDSFKLAIDKRYGWVKNEYFHNLVNYNNAYVEEFAQLADQEKLAKKFICYHPVLYDNTGYMEFFNDFFKEFLTMESQHITRDDLYRTINQVKSYNAFMDSLGKDTILKNEVIREMVAMKGLGELYYTKDFDQSVILEFYKNIEENSKFPQHRLIAENYLKIFTRLAPGTKAPDFTLKGNDGQTYSLSELNKDKYVYLIFWKTWCTPCISEMEVVNKLMVKYGTKVQFVGIATDKEYLTYYYFMQNNKKINFTTLWGNNAELMENYNIVAYPTFVLIDPDGKIVQCPAEKPSSDLDAILRKLTTEKKQTTNNPK
jgi:peroxiredoxin